MGVERRHCVVLQLCWNVCPHQKWSGEIIYGLMKKKNREGGGMWRPLSLPYCADYLLFFLWMFAGSFFSGAGSYMKWQMKPSYVLCLPQQSYFILHVWWLLNIYKIELRFLNCLLGLDKLRRPVQVSMAQRARHLGVFMGLKSQEDDSLKCGADCILGGESEKSWGWVDLILARSWCGQT